MDSNSRRLSASINFIAACKLTNILGLYSPSLAMPTIMLLALRCMRSHPHFGDSQIVTGTERGSREQGAAVQVVVVVAATAVVEEEEGEDLWSEQSRSNCCSPS